MGKQVRSVSPEALDLLEAYDWPGNVRELQAAIKYALVQAAGEVLTPDCLPATSARASARHGRPRRGRARPSTSSQLVRDLLRVGEPDLYAKVIAAVDRVVLEEVLRHVRGNQVQRQRAARHLADHPPGQAPRRRAGRREAARARI